MDADGDSSLSCLDCDDGDALSFPEPPSCATLSTTTATASFPSMRRTTTLTVKPSAKATVMTPIPPTSRAM